VVDAASVGIPAGGADIAAGTLRQLTFGGEPSVTIAAGARVLSDPVALGVDGTSMLTVSLYVAGDSGPSTMHTRAHQTNYVSAPGNYVMDETMPVVATRTSWFWLSGVEVLAHPNTKAVATAGDSITEGFNSTVDANARYPDELARRLLARNGVDPDALDFFRPIPLKEDKTPHFKAIRDEFRVNPGRAYACGDEKKDFVAAMSCGMHPFMVSYGFEDYERLTEKVGVPPELISRAPEELAARVTHALDMAATA
jgi:hypothetical protein